MIQKYSWSLPLRITVTNCTRSLLTTGNELISLAQDMISQLPGTWYRGTRYQVPYSTDGQRPAKGGESGTSIYRYRYLIPFVTQFVANNPVTLPCTMEVCYECSMNIPVDEATYP